MFDSSLGKYVKKADHNIAIAKQNVWLINFLSREKSYFRWNPKWKYVVKSELDYIALAYSEVREKSTSEANSLLTVCDLSDSS